MVTAAHPRITVEPGKRDGMPCIRGMRITVNDVLGWLAHGMTEEEILDEHPGLQQQDFAAVYAFAAELTNQVYSRPELAQARSALKKVAGGREFRGYQLQQAMEWLSRNKQQYAGQWIALQGSRLLATGIAAKEVYSQIQGEQPPPLVVKVEQDELPFAGW